jgi:cysteine desulfurase
MSKAPASGNGIIYLDFAATTPVDPSVADLMLECLGEGGAFANPSSTHGPGRAARLRVEAAREQVAGLIGADSGEVLFTSGATEADNMAIRGAALFQARRGKHIITSRTEHRAVLDPCKALEQEGFEVSWLVPEDRGRVSVEQLSRTLRPDTVLVSLMHVNNETGLRQDIEALGALCRARDVLLHVDAAQSAGKLPIDVRAMQVDLMSFSAHKIYGPKGAGALFVSRTPRCNLVPILFGGGQEQGLRPGTLATHQIVGMGRAFELAGQRMAQDQDRIAALRQRLWSGLLGLGGVVANGEAACCLPNILNVSFEGVEGESLMFGLPGLAISSGSACASAIREPSYVLRALGRDDQAAQASLRFSLGRATSVRDVDQALQMVSERVLALRELAPVHGADRHGG